MAAAAKKAPAKTALDRFHEKMAKTFGEGVFMVPGAISRYEAIPTGSISLDYYLGTGGLVEGRLHELWGQDGAGKTTLAYHFLAEAQRKYDGSEREEKLVGFADVEHRGDHTWMRANGLDLKRVEHVKPNNAEEVADMVKEMCRSGLFSAIVLDSIGAMLPDKAKDKDADESVMGKEAQVVTRMVKLLASEADRTQTTILFLNQVRANFSYGADITTPGGFALKHSTTTKMKISGAGGADGLFKLKIAGEDRIVGRKIAVKIERNSVAPGNRTATFSMFYIPTAKYGPVGIDAADEAVTVGLISGVIQQGGAWYTITPTGEKVNGSAALVETVREQGLAPMIREQSLAVIASEVHEEEATPDEPDEDAPPTGRGAVAARAKGLLASMDVANPDGVTLPNHFRGDS